VEAFYRRGHLTVPSPYLTLLPKTLRIFGKKNSKLIKGIAVSPNNNYLSFGLLARKYLPDCPPALSFNRKKFM
jgi:hypothetical protein